MDVVNRYLRIVRRYLPGGERDDIVAELSANLTAEFEDRERSLGRALTADESDAILRAHGDPISVALRYRSSTARFAFGPELVGPALFPSYAAVLALNAGVACLIGLAALVYAIPSWNGPANVVAHLALQCTIVTVVFVVLQRFLDGTWTAAPSRLARVRLEAVAALVCIVVTNLWLADVFASNDLFTPQPNSTLVLGQAWHVAAWPYAALVLLELARNVAILMRPRALRLRAVAIAVSAVVALIVLGTFARTGTFVLAVDRADARGLALAHGADVVALASCIVTALVIAVLAVVQIRRLIVNASMMAGVRPATVTRS